MATEKPVPKLDIPLLDIKLPAPINSPDIDGDDTASPRSVKEIRTDPEFDRAVRSVQRDFKQNALWVLKRRHTFFDPRRDKRRCRTSALPPPIDDPLAEMIQRHISTANLTLDGVSELPAGKNIVGAVLIIRKHGIDEFLCSLDKGKHGRWGFTGGRVDPNDLNIAHTLLRELKEETSLRGKNFRYAFIGLVPLAGAPDKASATFFTEIPEATMAKARPGREQRELKVFTRAEIYQMILKKEFLENHANYMMAWEHRAGTRL